jgi:hypothetical protein
MELTLVAAVSMIAQTQNEAPLLAPQHAVQYFCIAKEAMNEPLMAFYLASTYCTTSVRAIISKNLSSKPCSDYSHYAC